MWHQNNSILYFVVCRGVKLKLMILLWSNESVVALSFNIQSFAWQSHIIPWWLAFLKPWHALILFPQSVWNISTLVLVMHSLFSLCTTHKNNVLLCLYLKCLALIPFHLDYCFPTFVIMLTILMECISSLCNSFSTIRESICHIFMCCPGL